MAETGNVASALVAPEQRLAAGFGGIVPTAAVARSEATAVMALAVEHHAEGAAIPVVIVSDAPGLLTWDPDDGLTAVDDVGTHYVARTIAQSGTLGSLAVTIWLEPAIPSSARRLELSLTAVNRLSATRTRASVERALTGGPWELSIDLTPERTVASPPFAPHSADPLPPRPTSVPVRSVGALERLVPIGQARIRPAFTLALWSIEAYLDRAVLSLGLLVDHPSEAGHLFPDAGRVSVWDDLGNRYRATPTGGITGPGWSESTVEIVPAPSPAGATLGIEVDALPIRDADGQAIKSGPLTFGVAINSAR